MALKHVTVDYGNFFYYEPDAIGQRIARGEFHDEHLRPYLDALQRDDVFVDVGANIGFLSIYAAKRGAIVEAFEADNEIAALMKQNVFENNLLDRIRIHNDVLYDSHTRLMINPKWTDYTEYVTGGIDWGNSPNSGGLSLVPHDGSATREKLYLTRMLDDWGLERVKLLKVDTQGSDLRVLVGAIETIKRCRPVICFEFEHDGSGQNASKDSMGDFVIFCSDLNYAVRKISEGTYGEDYMAVPA